MNADEDGLLLDSLLQSSIYSSNSSVRSKREKKVNKINALRQSASSSALDTPVSPALSCSSPKSHVNTNDIHSVNDLMHRVSAVSGSIPGFLDVRTVKTPASNVEAAKIFSQIQLKGMNDNASIQAIISQVIGLNKELSDEIFHIAAHRKELAARVDVINQNYLILFERIMSEILSMQRRKFRAMTDQVPSLTQFLFLI